MPALYGEPLTRSHFAFPEMAFVTRHGLKCDVVNVPYTTNAVHILATIIAFVFGCQCRIIPGYVALLHVSVVAMLSAIPWQLDKLS